VQLDKEIQQTDLAAKAQQELLDRQGANEKPREKLEIEKARLEA